MYYAMDKLKVFTYRFIVTSSNGKFVEDLELDYYKLDAYFCRHPFSLLTNKKATFYLWFAPTFNFFYLQFLPRSTIVTSNDFDVIYSFLYREMC